MGRGPSRRGTAGNGRVRILGTSHPGRATSKDVEQRIDLKHGNAHLWGVSEAFIPGAMSAVDLERVS